jgi:hypothetical protein
MVKKMAHKVLRLNREWSGICCFYASLRAQNSHTRAAAVFLYIVVFHYFTFTGEQIEHVDQ